MDIHRGNKRIKILIIVVFSQDDKDKGKPQESEGLHISIASSVSNEHVEGFDSGLLHVFAPTISVVSHNIR